VLRRMGHLVPARPPTAVRPVHALRAALPWSIRFRLHQRLSQEQRDRAMQAIWLQQTDWARTRAFSQPEPGHGWIRLNVAGREPEGLVAPGDEARGLADEIAHELSRLENADTGEPAVDGVLRQTDLGDGPRVRDLPDLTLRFPAGDLLRRVRHPRLGVWEEDLRDAPYTEHSGEGFLVAAGPGIRAGAATEGVTEDVPATLLALTGVEPPARMDGAPLSALLARAPA
jgi:predicted AlkP superfamily phosphohydrolase/phosphomutase